MGFYFLLIFIVMFAAIPLVMFPIELFNQYKYREKGIPQYLLSFMVSALPILIYFLVPSPGEKFADLMSLSLNQGLLIVGWFGLIIGSFVLDLKRAGKMAKQRSAARKAIDDAQALRQQASALQKQTLANANIVSFTIKDGYSYARERLKSHMNLPDDSRKTLEILDDVVRVISEYISAPHRTIAVWDIGELTQYLDQAKTQGLKSVMVAEKNAKMMRPILAGLKKLVLIHDCGMDWKDIPNDVDLILKIKGPSEVDGVVNYLREKDLA